MKRFIAILIILSAFICCCLTVNAQGNYYDTGLGGYSYACKVKKADMNGANYQIYFSGCRGHYDDDTVTIYITNTSDGTRTFQVTVGFQGGDVQTTAESGYVEIPKGVTGKFVLENISRYPEKANNELGYVPGSALSENSVVRVQVNDAEEGDTFVVTGFQVYNSAKDSSFSAIDSDAITRQFIVPNDIAKAKLVIKIPESEKKQTETKEYTLVKPDTDSVNKFIIFTACSAVVCLGGVAIFAFSYFTKKEKKNDRD